MSTTTLIFFRLVFQRTSRTCSECRKTGDSMGWARNRSRQRIPLYSENSRQKTCRADFNASLMARNGKGSGLLEVAAPIGTSRTCPTAGAVQTASGGVAIVSSCANHHARSTADQPLKFHFAAFRAFLEWRVGNPLLGAHLMTAIRTFVFVCDHDSSCLFYLYIAFKCSLLFRS